MVLIPDMMKGGGAMHLFGMLVRIYPPEPRLFDRPGMGESAVVIDCYGRLNSWPADLCTFVCPD